MKERCILLTGGTGFVGRNLIDRLSKEYRCIHLGRNRNDNCENLYWNLLDCLPDSISSCFPNGSLAAEQAAYPDCLVHCASIVGVNERMSPSEYIDINVKATLQLLGFCVKNRIGHFVYISTGGVYGQGPEPFAEEDECKPQDLYCLTKYFSELLCRLYADRLRITVLRPFFPYGTGQRGRLIPNLIQRVMDQQPVYLNNEGFPRINPIHIDDLAGLTAGIVREGIPGTFNLSGDEVFSILDICEMARRKLKIASAGYVFTNKGSQHLTGSNKKICGILNYRMQVGFEEGIGRLLEGEIQGLKPKDEMEDGNDRKNTADHA